MYNRRKILFECGLPHYAGVFVGGFQYLTYGLDLAIPVVDDGFPIWADRGKIGVPVGESDIKGRRPLTMTDDELLRHAQDVFPDRKWNAERLVHIKPFVGAVIAGCRNLSVFERIKAIGVYL